MNETWKQLEADAHEAKGEALDLAHDTLAGVIDIVEKLNRPHIDAAMDALAVEAKRHHDAATLARTNGAAA